jgi:hypothetical protein
MGNFQTAKTFAKTFPFMTGGAVVGGAAGAYGGSRKSFTDIHTGKKVNRTPAGRVASGISNGIGGAVGGAYLGGMADSARLAKKHGPNWQRNMGGGYEGYARRNGGAPAGKAAPEKPDWLKGAKTKAEARKAFHAQSRKAHPDLGGSDAAQKEINKAWEHWEGQYKNAMYAGFADELEKIAKGM